MNIYLALAVRHPDHPEAAYSNTYVGGDTPQEAARLISQILWLDKATEKILLMANEVMTPSHHIKIVAYDYPTLAEQEEAQMLAEGRQWRGLEPTPE